MKPSDSVRHLSRTPRARGPHARYQRGVGRPRGHPRVRGAKSWLRGGAADYRGTLPRAWAPRRERVDHAFLTGPSSRGGDHGSETPMTIIDPGTPPRARGPHNAGAIMQLWPGEHPRVRGDHRDSSSSARSRAGTPPRARGPHLPLRQTREAEGNTPACAGTTRSPSSPTSAPREHPRVRGDHRGYLQGGRSGPGNTPACAGTTQTAGLPSTTAGEHPRVRGDHWNAR